MARLEFLTNERPVPSQKLRRLTITYCDTIADRDAIIAGERFQGRRVYAADTGLEYEWSPTIGGGSWVTPVGHIIPVANAAARPLNPRVGQMVYRIDAQSIEVWNGAAWKSQKADTVTLASARNMTTSTRTVDGTTVRADSMVITNTFDRPLSGLVAVHGFLQCDLTSGSGIISTSLVPLVDGVAIGSAFPVSSFGATSGIAALNYGVLVEASFQITVPAGSTKTLTARHDAVFNFGATGQSSIYGTAFHAHLTTA